MADSYNQPPMGDVNYAAQPQTPQDFTSAGITGALAMSFRSTIKNPQMPFRGNIKAPIGLKNIIGYAGSGGMSSALGGFGGSMLYGGNPYVAAAMGAISYKGGFSKLPILKDTALAGSFQNRPGVQLLPTPGSLKLKGGVSYGSLVKKRQELDSVIKGTKWTRGADAVDAVYADVGDAWKQAFDQDAPQYKAAVASRQKVNRIFQKDSARLSVKRVADEYGLDISSGDSRSILRDLNRKQKGLVKPENIRASMRANNKKLRQFKYKRGILNVRGININVDSQYDDVVQRIFDENQEARRMDTIIGKQQTKANKITDDFTRAQKQSRIFTSAQNALAPDVVTSETERFYKLESTFGGSKYSGYSADEMTTIKKMKSKFGINKRAAARRFSFGQLQTHLAQMSKKDLAKLGSKYGVVGKITPKAVTKAIGANSGLIGGAVKFGKVASVVGMVGIGVEIAKLGARGVVSGITAINEASNKLRSLEFGGPGRAVQTQGATTERQRALQALQNSTMNARQFIGQEGALLHS